jgi:FkbM family methyltransferase
MGRYFWGIDNRAKRIVESYWPELLSRDMQERIKIVIDIGCNDGSFLRFFSERSSLLGVELEYNESQCAQLNVPESTILNVGAWNKDGINYFQSVPESSDSSIIPNARDRGLRLIPTLRLSTIVELLYKNEIVDLIKIDAEGAEIEVLEGAQNILHKVRWFLIDVGPERGLDKARTSVHVEEFMTRNNFKKMFERKLGREVVVYQNSSLIS